MIALDVVLLILAFYFLQEGMAQRAAGPTVEFFVEFPHWLVYPAGAAALVLLPNFAVNILTLLRDLPPRRWVWLTTGLAVVLLAVVTVVLGVDDVLTVINPNW